MKGESKAGWTNTQNSSAFDYTRRWRRTERGNNKEWLSQGEKRYELNVALDSQLLHTAMSLIRQNLYYSVWQTAFISQLQSSAPNHLGSQIWVTSGSWALLSRIDAKNGASAWDDTHPNCVTVPIKKPYSFLTCMQKPHLGIRLEVSCSVGNRQYKMCAEIAFRKRFTKVSSNMSHFTIIFWIHDHLFLYFGALLGSIRSQ